MKLLRKLWNDEAGFIVSAELVLVATIVVISMIVGLVCIRNQVVQELIDVGLAIGNINQSYAYGGITTPTGHPWAYVGGASYVDYLDYCQTSVQTSGSPAGGITIIGVTPTTATLAGEQ
jgi:hypothetical protein